MITLLCSQSLTFNVPMWGYIFQARQLIGSALLVREEDRPQLEEGEIYTRDLVGMKVILKVRVNNVFYFQKI